MSLSPKSKQLQRSAYSIIDVLGDVGGIVSAVVSSTYFVIWTLAKIDFQLEAIQQLFKIKFKSNLKKMNYF
jgi:hypothetical protein